MLISRDWRDVGLLLMRVAKTIILPYGVWGITSWSLLTLEQSGKGESLQTAFP